EAGIAVIQAGVYGVNSVSRVAAWRQGRDAIARREPVRWRAARIWLRPAQWPALPGAKIGQRQSAFKRPQVGDRSLYIGRSLKPQPGEVACKDGQRVRLTGQIGVRVERPLLSCHFAPYELAHEGGCVWRIRQLYAAGEQPLPATERAILGARLRAQAPAVGSRRHPARTGGHLHVGATRRLPASRFPSGGRARLSREYAGRHVAQGTAVPFPARERRGYDLAARSARRLRRRDRTLARPG